jgi:hypothetical protein
MALYKDEKRNTWYCKVNYLNEVGKLISHTKRGFKLKRDAINYESSFRCEQYEKQEIPVPELPCRNCRTGQRITLSGSLCQIH